MVVVQRSGIASEQAGLGDGALPRGGESPGDGQTVVVVVVYGKGRHKCVHLPSIPSEVQPQQQRSKCLSRRSPFRRLQQPAEWFRDMDSAYTALMHVCSPPSSPRQPSEGCLDCSAEDILSCHLHSMRQQVRKAK